MSTQPTPPDATPEIPQVSFDEAANLIADAHRQADAQQGGEELLDEAALERLKTQQTRERTELPPTPLEKVMEPDVPTARSTTVDSSWLTNYPDVRVQNAIPSEDDKVRFGICLIRDEPFEDVQNMWNNKLAVHVRLLTGQVLDELYEYLRPFREAKDAVDPYLYSAEMQFAGAAAQVVMIGDKRLSLADTRDTIKARVVEFKAMQNIRWTAVLLAVRQANLKGRMLSEMIVNYDSDFSSPDASASR